MTTYLGKSCSFCLPRVPFVNCRQFVYLVISLLVLRAGYGIWLYQFLIIAYLFTLSMEEIWPLDAQWILISVWVVFVANRYRRSINSWLEHRCTRPVYSYPLPVEYFFHCTSSLGYYGCSSYKYDKMFIKTDSLTSGLPCVSPRAKPLWGSSMIITWSVSINVMHFKAVVLYQTHFC